MPSDEQKQADREAREQAKRQAEEHRARYAGPAKDLAERVRKVDDARARLANAANDDELIDAAAMLMAALDGERASLARLSQLRHQDEGA